MPVSPFLRVYVGVQLWATRQKLRTSGDLLAMDAHEASYPFILHRAWQRIVTNACRTSSTLKTLCGNSFALPCKDSMIVRRG